MAVDYADVHSAYDAERGDYEDLAALIGSSLEDRLAARRLEIIVQWRAKDVHSFVKKALRKGYAEPLRQIGDKAGVRVIVHYLDDVEAVEREVREICTVRERESKLDALDYDELGYLGIHLEVQPTPALAAQSVNARVRELRAELQIHTKAQSAWAVVSHDLLYKPPIELPATVKRSVTRLVALTEMFDLEVQRLRQSIQMDPDYRELMVIEALDAELLGFTSRPPDRGLSALSVPSIVRLYDVAPESVVAERVAPFIVAVRAKLDALYQRYRDDARANPLLFQPEALLLFERFDHDSDRIRDAWPAERLPIELLDDLATIWGADIGGTTDA